MAAGEQMFRDEPGHGGVIHEHARKLQVRSAKAEIHGGLAGVGHEIREIIAGAEPCQNAIAFPTPRDDFLARGVGQRCQPCSCANFSMPRCNR
jgi:hypothetical protein